MMPSTTKVLVRLWFACVASLLAAGPALAELVPLPPKPLVTATAGFYGQMFKIAPDGSKVFFTAQDSGPLDWVAPARLYEVPISGGPITTRTNPSHGFQGSVFGWNFSPNGKDLVFTEEKSFSNGQEYVMPIATGDPRQLTLNHNAPAAETSFFTPTFSQDGSRLLYLGWSDFSPQQLFSVALDGSAPPAPLNSPLPAWNDQVLEDWKLLPGGNDVLYVAPRVGDNGYNLFRVNAAGGTPTRVNLTEGVDPYTTGTNTFAIDSAASRVAYGVQKGAAGRPTVMSRSLSGGPEYDLSAGLAAHDDVRIDVIGFAHDLVIFEADFNKAYTNELYAAPASGGPAFVIGGPGYRAESAVISPDGNEVVFTSNIQSNQEGFLFDTDTQSVRSLGNWPVNNNNPWIQFNATGDYFLMFKSVDPPLLYSTKGDFIRSIPGYARFDPEGEHILYLAIEPGPNYLPELLMEQVNGAGNIVRISTDGSVNSGVDDFSFTTDESTLIYSRSRFGEPFELFAVSFVPEPGVAATAWRGLFVIWQRRRGCMSRA